MVGISSPGFGTIFRHIDFNDEDDGVQKYMIYFPLILQSLMVVGR